MQYRRLGHSDLMVSEIGLGTNNFGGRLADDAEAVRIVRAALDLGVNLIDTSANYGGDHRSEQLIGEAVRGRRSDALIATKGGGTFGGDGPVREQIANAVDASLRALGTDHVDVYHIRVTPAGSTIEEMLRAFEEQVRAGKVRWIGATNSPAWRLGEAVWTARTGGLPEPVSEQSLYNMLDRGAENELLPCCREHGVSLMPYYPLAGGFLAGRYRRGEQPPAGSRFALAEAQARRWTRDEHFDLLDRLQAFAAERGMTTGDLALAWLLSEPAVGTVIVGASNAGQIEANAASGERRLSAEDQALLRELVSARGSSQ